MIVNETQAWPPPEPGRLMSDEESRYWVERLRAMTLFGEAKSAEDDGFRARSRAIEKERE